MSYVAGCVCYDAFGSGVCWLSCNFCDILWQAERMVDYVMLKDMVSIVPKSPLQKKMVLLVCSMAVAVPVVLVSLLASAYYYLGIESLFSSQVHRAFDETVEISRLYVKEQEKHIADDVLLLANELDLKYDKVSRDPHLLEIFLDQQTNRLTLSRAILFEGSNIIAATLFNFSFIFETIPLSTLKLADRGVYVDKLLERSKIRAIARLDPVYKNIPNQEIYLVVERDIDQDISQHLVDVEHSAESYMWISANIEKIRFRVVLAFIIVTTAFLIASILLSNKWAAFIVRPINNLVNATKSIQSGDYTVRVPETTGKDETAILARAFNGMMITIDKQHNNLIQASTLIEERRNFIETVLEELSTGVLTIDGNERIILCNDAAVSLLQKSGRLAENEPAVKQKLSGTLYYDVFPELQELISNLFSNSPQSQPFHTKHIHDVSEECATPRLYSTTTKLHVDIGTTNDKRQFIVRTEPIYTKHNILHNVIVTFDDVTELVAAQRFAAWVDIARRIAHEVKNPLTPIQLIVERLQKKFSSQIKNDREQFDKYLMTIDRRVSDMRLIIQEFVEFSRISQAHISVHNLCEIITEAIFLQQSVSADVKYSFLYKGDDVYVECDNTQIMQVFINLFKNSTESIELKMEHGKYKSCNGEVSVALETFSRPGVVSVVVKDNGAGVKEGMLHKICEPYTSTKTGGMGLGLSIVRRIIDEHGGTIEIVNNNEVNGGVSVTFTLKMARS